MWSRDRVLAASHAWQWVPPGAEKLLIEEVVVIDYPAWASMGFYAMPAQVADPERAVEEVCGEARRRGRSATEWWISPSTRPDGLEELLVARGAVRSDAADVLALEMSDGVPVIPVPDDVQALVVTDERRLDDAERVAAAGR